MTWCHTRGRLTVEGEPEAAPIGADRDLRAVADRVDDEFRDFVSARSGALLRTAYLLAGDWATAEDLLQTALTKTYLAWRRLGQIEAVEPYARRVLVNTATSWWRRRWHGRATCWAGSTFW